MKKCTECGRDVVSQLVYDLPCGVAGCTGTIAFPVDNSVDDPVDDDVIEAEIVDDEPSIEVRSDPTGVIARFVPTPAASGGADQDQTVGRVIDLIEKRAALFDGVGFFSGGDLLRNLIDAIRSEFAK